MGTSERSKQTPPRKPSPGPLSQTEISRVGSGLDWLKANTWFHSGLPEVSRAGFDLIECEPDRILT
ncbi:hypothetical protein IEQ34_017100 [Dendrobium chrysotoxum]|uniref:Uncharacterized protein n=1 Tax=Dendrobium chrysotoxum TaxID=161865 RepID=A0AAV7G8M8_DENCH|nr:hypothetical protein IEQ34_017100 [Dendrobium chrysotoxum]